MPIDYLYPLEQTGQQYVVNGRAATPEVLALEAASGEHSCFLVSAHIGDLEREDRIWFRASLPEQRLVAMGWVQAPAYEGTDDGLWRVVVAFDRDISRRLQQDRDAPVVRAARQAVWEATAEESAALKRYAGLKALT
ncbi:hypothetical protein [Rhizocola hellebori]|nr:hypothetical protein [Rhizocola hellebori]